MSRAIDLLDRSRSRFKRQDPWRPIWQELAEHFQPSKANFTSEASPGQANGYDIYDSTPRQAMLGLATTIGEMLKGSSARWFWMKSEDEARNDIDSVKRWFDAVGNSMWRAIYNPRSGFISHSGAVDRDLATFGLGFLWIGENKDRMGLNFRSLFIGDTAIDENSDGVVDSADIRRKYTARQAGQLWERSHLGPKVLEALDSSKDSDKDKVFTFIQCISPRADYDRQRLDAINMPFASYVVCEEDEHLVEESGFKRFPIAVPRWEVSANQIYPWSPGMMALPDSRTLQTMGHTLLVGGQLAVDPPRWVVDDGLLSAVRTWPGGLTVVNADTVRDTNGNPMGTLDMGANIPVGREMQDDYRRMVEAAFFKNVFNLPVAGPQMTAYEVAQRKQELLRTVGPTMGQLEKDYPGVIVERVFQIMMDHSFDRNGNHLPGAPFPALPDELKGAPVRFEFMSPVQQAKRQIEAQGLAMAFEFLTPIAPLSPSSMLRIDVDQIIDDMPDAFGLPQRWLKPKNQFEQERAAALEAQAAMAETEAVGQAAQIGATAADGLKKAAQADAAMAGA